MIKIQTREIELRELDGLEELLDGILGTRNKTGIRDGPVVEQISGRVRAGRMKTYDSKKGRAIILADLQQSGRYEIELSLDLREEAYDLLLQLCKKQAPSIYAQLPKSEDKRAANY